MGAGLAVVILLLLRRDHLYVLYALFWLVVAAVALVLGLWPGVMDWLAAHLGITYPPALLLLCGLLAVLLKVLHLDLLHTHQERQIRRLNQRIAMLELQLEPHLVGRADAPPPTQAHPTTSAQD